jgi:hypothetical protein
MPSLQREIVQVRVSLSIQAGVERRIDAFRRTVLDRDLMRTAYYDD